MSLNDADEPRPALTAPEKPMLLDAPEHPELVAFAAYLDGKRAGCGLADRNDINPAEILPFLPHIIILDVVEGGADFRVRVFGTALVELMREERTGQLVSQFGERPAIPTDPVELRSRWLTICKATMEKSQAVFFKAPTVSPARAYMIYHGMFAPLTARAAGTAGISQIIGMMVTVGLR